MTAKSPPFNRRRFSGRSAIAVMSSALIVAAALTTGCAGRSAAAPVSRSASSSDTWPAYQLRPDHNAVLDRSGFAASWSFDAHARLNGGLAVDGDTLYFDTFAPSVVALYLESGALRWETPVDNIVMSTPILSSDMVYVGTGSNHHMSPTRWGRPQGDRVIALDKSDGRQRWTYRTVGEDMPSPVFANGSLVFANGDAHAYALDASSGTLHWRRQLEGVSTMASATAQAGVAFLSTCTLQLEPGATSAVDVRNGSVRWRAPYGNCDSSPTVAGTRVFVSGIRLEPAGSVIGYRALVTALDARSGKVKWTYRSPDTGISTTFVSSERAVAGTYAGGIYYQAIPTHDRLMAFDAVSGRALWSFKTVAPAKMSPVVKDGYLYLGDTAGCLYTLDAKRGTLANVQTFDAPFSTSPPIIVGDTMIVAVGTKIRAFWLRNGLPVVTRTESH